MTIYPSRLFVGAADLQAMIDLLRVARPAARFGCYPGLEALREMLAIPAIQANTRLWFTTEGQIVGFALVDAYHNLLFEVVPEARCDALYAAVVEWGVECIQQMRHAGETAPTLDASCREEDRERVALLEQFGFVAQTVRSLGMKRSLAEPIPEPLFPPGFTLRPAAAAHETGRWVKLHRAAFGTEHMTHEERLAMLDGPDYDPALDLLVTAPNGDFAAYCMCSVSPEENARTGCLTGYTDPVATHPDYQRRGLARALLLRGLQLLKERGMEVAALGTSSENVAMQRAAESVGFWVDGTSLWFEKPVLDA